MQDARTEAAKQRVERTAPSGAAARPAAVVAEFAAPVAVPTPDLDVQWRIVSGTAVQRTTDRGRTWTTQVTGATRPLYAGSAPSATICWLVGAGGTVLLTLDGHTWTPVSFPEAVDLSAVKATSAVAAAVIAADGRTFTTADAGRTWSR